MILRQTIAGAAFVALAAMPAFAAGGAPAPAPPAAAPAPQPAQAAPSVPRSTNGLVELINLMATGSGADVKPASTPAGAASAGASKTTIVIPAAREAEPHRTHRRATRHHARRHYATRHSRGHEHAAKAAASPAPAQVPVPAPASVAAAPESVSVRTTTISPPPATTAAPNIETGRASAEVPGAAPTDAVKSRFQKASAGAVKVVDPQTLRTALSAAGRKIAAKRQGQPMAPVPAGH